MLTVRELIQELQKIENQDLWVFIPRDWSGDPWAGAVIIDEVHPGDDGVVLI